MMSSKMTHI